MLVVVVGGPEKKKIVQTAVVDETSDPKWSAEYSVQLPSYDVDLEFQVWHHNKVFKNELLGTYRVRLSEVSGLEAGVKVRAEIAPSESSSSSPSHAPAGTPTSPHLLLLMCSFPNKPVPLASVNTFTPLSQQWWTATAFPAFRLHLDRFSYNPGETVKGSLIYVSSSTAPKKIEGIEISATGKTHFEFRSPQPVGLPATKDMSTNAFKTPLDYFWFIVRCPVSGRVEFSNKPSPSSSSSTSSSSGATRVEEVGTICAWPFQFVLPAHLPPSYSRQSFNTTYTFTATAHIDGRAQQVSKDVIIMPNFLTLPPPSLATSTVLSAVSPATVAQGVEPNVGVEWTSAPIAYIDHQHEATVRISNGSHHNFAKFTMHMRTMRVYTLLRPDGKGWSANTFLEQICESPVASAVGAPGQRSLLSLPAGYAQPTPSASVFLIPQNTQMAQSCYSSVPESVFPELIQVHHWIELVGHTDQGALLSLSKLPIYVTQVSFVPPFGLTPSQAAASLEPSVAGTPVARFRIARAQDASHQDASHQDASHLASAQSSQSSSAPIGDPSWTATPGAPSASSSSASVPSSSSSFDPHTNHSLVIPLGGLTHPLYLLTQGTNAAGLAPQNSNQSLPLPHASFEFLQPSTPEQQVSPSSDIAPFPLDQHVPLMVEHSESFDRPMSGLARRPGDFGSVSINSNLGVNLQYESFGLNDLNRTLFGGSSFGK